MNHGSEARPNDATLLGQVIFRDIGRRGFLAVLLGLYVIEPDAFQTPPTHGAVLRLSLLVSLVRVV